jgi:hypothetical protein
VVVGYGNHIFAPFQASRKGCSPRSMFRKHYSGAHIPSAPTPTSPVYTGGIIHGRPPSHHSPEPAALSESRFTIPDVPQNAEFYAQRAHTQAQLFTGKKLLLPNFICV